MSVIQKIDRTIRYLRTANKVAVGMAGTALLSLVVISLAPMALAQSNAVALARNFRPDPVKLEGSTSGSVDLRTIAGIDKCRGFAGNQPNHTLRLTDNFPLVDLLVYTSKVNDDPTLLIKGSNGLVVCADDEYQGRSPQLSRRLPEGTYQIWVGSADANKSIRYTLSLSEIRQK